MKAANILVSTGFPPHVGVESGLWWGQGEGITSVSGRSYFGKQHSHWGRHHRRSGSSDWGGCDTPTHTHTHTHTAPSCRLLGSGSPQGGGHIPCTGQLMLHSPAGWGHLQAQSQRSRPRKPLAQRALTGQAWAPPRQGRRPRPCTRGWALSPRPRPCTRGWGLSQATAVHPGVGPSPRPRPCTRGWAPLPGHGRAPGGGPLSQATAVHPGVGPSPRPPAGSAGRALLGPLPGSPAPHGPALGDQRASEAEPSSHTRPLHSDRDTQPPRDTDLKG